MPPSASQQLTPTHSDESWNVLRLPTAPDPPITEEEDLDDGVIDLSADNAANNNNYNNSYVSSRSQVGVEQSVRSAVVTEQGISIAAEASFSGLDRFRKRYLHHHQQRTASVQENGGVQHFQSTTQQLTTIAEENPSLSKRNMFPSENSNSPYYAVAQHPYHRQRYSQETSYLNDMYAGDLNRVATAAYSKAIKDAAILAAVSHSNWNRPPQQQPQHSYQPIIIQNTTKAIAESEIKTNTENQTSLVDKCLDILNIFWSSKINKIIILGISGITAYFYWEWWQHRKRMDLLQRRIDANPILKLSQLISSSADRK